MSEDFEKMNSLEDEISYHFKRRVLRVKKLSAVLAKVGKKSHRSFFARFLTSPLIPQAKRSKC